MLSGERGLSHWWMQSKTVEVMVMQFSLFSPLVLRDNFHPEILTGSTRAGASNKGGVGGGKQAVF